VDRGQRSTAANALFAVITVVKLANIPGFFVAAWYSMDRADFRPFFYYCVVTALAIDMLESVLATLEGKPATTYMKAKYLGSLDPAKAGIKPISNGVSVFIVLAVVGLSLLMIIAPRTYWTTVLVLGADTTMFAAGAALQWRLKTRKLWPYAATFGAGFVLTLLVGAIVMHLNGTWRS
jgi:hypothetical protein